MHMHIYKKKKCVCMYIQTNVYLLFVLISLGMTMQDQTRKQILTIICFGAFLSLLIRDEPLEVYLCEIHNGALMLFWCIECVMPGATTKTRWHHSFGFLAYASTVPFRLTYPHIGLANVVVLELAVLADREWLITILTRGIVSPAITAYCIWFYSTTDLPYVRTVFLPMLCIAIVNVLIFYYCEARKLTKSTVTDNEIV